MVILGAGYGGLMTAVKLQKELSMKEATITLINKHDYHYQSTWLHENAAGTLHHDRTRITIRDVIDMNRINFVKDTVVSIDPEKKQVKLAFEEIKYDILVIGLGFEAATFGIPGLKDNAFSIGSIDSARLIKEHIEYNFAMYSNEDYKKQARINLVVGGAGFTGMEFVGELANRIPELCKEFDVDSNLVRIIVIESASTIMPGFCPELIEYARNSIEGRGVEFITDAKLRECKEESIVYEKNGEDIEIPTMTTVWAAGVKANKIVETSGFKTYCGRIETRNNLLTSEYDDVFVVGDCALTKDPETNKPCPPTAQIAVQEAELVSRNIGALIRNEQLEAFRPKELGTVASLGNNDAIGTIMNKYMIFGWKATMMKKFIENRYLFKIGGIRLVMNKGRFNFFY